MNSLNGTEAQFLLRKILTIASADLSLNYLWISETDRWKELAFALLVRVARLPENPMRELTHRMNDLGLLEIAALASVRSGSGVMELDHPHARHIMELLQEYGLSPEESRRGLTVLCEAALGLSQHFDGKVQLYLRGYGELILQDLARHFHFSALNEAEVKYAFTYWLQNVLNMPLSLLDETLVAYCKQHGLTTDQFIAAADELDVNLALLDDLVHAYLSRPVVEKNATQKQISSEGQEGSLYVER